MGASGAPSVVATTGMMVSGSVAWLGFAAVPGLAGSITPFDLIGKGVWTIRQGKPRARSGARSKDAVTARRAAAVQTDILRTSAICLKIGNGAKIDIGQVGNPNLLGRCRRCAERGGHQTSEQRCCSWCAQVPRIAGRGRWRHRLNRPRSLFWSDNKRQRAIVGHAGGHALES